MRMMMEMVQTKKMMTAIYTCDRCAGTWVSSEVRSCCFHWESGGVRACGGWWLCDFIEERTGAYLLPRDRVCGTALWSSMVLQPLEAEQTLRLIERCWTWMSRSRVTLSNSISLVPWGVYPLSHLFCIYNKWHISNQSSRCTLHKNPNHTQGL